MATNRPYVKQRKDVQDLTNAVNVMIKSQASFFSKLTTSGDAYKKQLDIAIKLAEVLKDSNKWSEEENNNAEQRVNAAKLMLDFGKKQTFVQKAVFKKKLEQLKLDYKKSGVEDKITEKLIDQMDAQAKGVSLAEKMKGVAGKLDSAFFDVGDTIKGFLTNPLTLIGGLLTAYTKQIGEISDNFGAIGVTKYKDRLTDAKMEFVEMGMSGEDLYATINKLGDSFGIGTDKATQMSTEVADLAKSTGLGVEDSAQLVGYFSEIQGYTAEGAKNMMKQTAALAEANGVAPNVVMRDIAESSETFAKFSKDGGDNLIEAAVQARKLGISLNTVSETAEGLLDFQSSLSAEIEASMMLGRNLNLQKARELALAGDMAGLQNEITNLVGSEAEWEEMNVLQRKALAKALNMDLASLDKVVRKQKEQVTLGGELAKQDISKLVPEEAMTGAAETMAKMQALGIQLVNDFGEPFMQVVESLVPQVISILESISGWTTWLSETVGISNLLYGVMAGMVAKSMANLAIQAGIAYSKGAGSLGPGAIAALSAMPIFIGTLMAGMTALVASTAMAEGGIVKASSGGTLATIGEGGRDEAVIPLGTSAADRALGSKTSTDNTGTLAMRTFNREISMLRNEIVRLREDHEKYFSIGGSVPREIARNVKVI